MAANFLANNSSPLNLNSRWLPLSRRPVLGHSGPSPAVILGVWVSSALAFRGVYFGICGVGSRLVWWCWTVVSRLLSPLSLLFHPLSLVLHVSACYLPVHFIFIPVCFYLSIARAPPHCLPSHLRLPSPGPERIRWCRGHGCRDRGHGPYPWRVTS